MRAHPISNNLHICKRCRFQQRNLLPTFLAIIRLFSPLFRIGTDSTEGTFRCSDIWGVLLHLKSKYHERWEPSFRDQQAQKAWDKTSKKCPTRQKQKDGSIQWWKAFLDAIYKYIHPLILKSCHERHFLLEAVAEKTLGLFGIYGQMCSWCNSNSISGTYLY